MAKTVIFHSRYTEHELIRRPKDSEPTRTGGYRIVQTRISYQFHAAPAPDGQGGLIGVCVVPVGKDRMVESNPEGWLAAGEDHDKERDAVDALRAHNAFGHDFWEAGHAPGTLYPRPQDFRRELMASVGTLDEERLVAMLAEERGSHHRLDLIGDAEVALATVREQLTAAQAAAEAEAEAKKPAPKAKATA